MKPRHWITLLLSLCLLGGWLGNSQAAPDDSIIRTYQRAISADPNDVIAHFNLGLAFYKLDKLKEAKETLEKCIRVNRGDRASHQQVDGPANQLLGIIYYSHDRNDSKAIAAFQRSLRLLPNDPDTYYALGLASLRNRKYSAAIKAFNQAIASGRTQDAEVYYQRGRAQMEMKREKEVVASYQKALELNPDFQPALEALGLIYHRQKKVSAAIQVLERLAKLDPMNFNANYLLGLNYYQQKKFPEMVAAYNRAITVKPDLADAHYNLGMAYFYQTRYDLAIEALKKAVTLNPKDSEAFNLLGQAQTAAVDTYLQSGSVFIAQELYSKAIESFKKVLSIDPSHHKAKALLADTERVLREEMASHLALANKFYGEGQWEEAFNEYEHAARLNPDSREAQDGMRKIQSKITTLLTSQITKGKKQQQAGNYQAAKRHYEIALEAKPGYAKAIQALEKLEDGLQVRMQSHYNQGNKYAAQGNITQAVKHYTLVKQYAKVFNDKKWADSAIYGLGKVNDKKEGKMKRLLASGKRAFKNGDTAGAKKAFNQVLAMDSGNQEANRYIERMTGAKSDAKVNADKIKDLYYKGVDLYVKGQIEQAILAWKEVRRLDPDNDDAKINIRRAESKLIAIKKLTEGR